MYLACNNRMHGYSLLPMIMIATVYVYIQLIVAEVVGLVFSFEC
jgi:hypothetical protein